MNEFIQGNLRSRTNWLAVSLTLIGYLQLPDTQRLIATLLSAVAEPETVDYVLACLTMACGLLAIVIRNLTTEPIAVKGAR